MNKMEIALFAVPTDWPDVLGSIESDTSLVYVEAGLFDVPILRKHSSFIDIQGLGIALTGERNRERSFLVMKADVEIEVRSVPQRNGKMKYAVDQLRNPKAVVFQPAGLYEGRCIIAGQIGTVSSHADSVGLYRLFLRRISARFTKVKSFWVGKGAKELMAAEARLTSNVRSPESYDLRI